MKLYGSDSDELYGSGRFRYSISWRIYPTNTNHRHRSVSSILAELDSTSIFIEFFGQNEAFVSVLFFPTIKFRLPPMERHRNRHLPFALEREDKKRFGRKSGKDQRSDNIGIEKKEKRQALAKAKRKFSMKFFVYLIFPLQDTFVCNINFIQPIDISGLFVERPLES